MVAVVLPQGVLYSGWSLPHLAFRPLMVARSCVPDPSCSHLPSCQGSVLLSGCLPVCLMGPAALFPHPQHPKQLFVGIIQFETFSFPVDE